MGGSYGHIVTKKGKLRDPQSLTGMLECSSGDVYEACEELYGMIWFLATQVSLRDRNGDTAAEIVEHARDHYEDGLKLSPGLKAGMTVNQMMSAQLRHLGEEI